MIRTLSVFLILAFAGVSPAPPAAQTLQPGAALERRLAAKEIHAYEIDVPKGRFLGIRVDQRGADVVVTVFEPGGSALRKHDGPSGDVGVESVSFVSPRSARYRVEISSFDQQAFPGGYRIELDGPRAPRDGDTARIAAEVILEKAEVEFDRGTADSYAAARAGYEEAARRFASIDPEQQAMVLLGAASANTQRGRTDDAERIASQALAAARRARDPRLESMALDQVSFNRFLREGRPEAMEPLRQAIALDSSPRIRSAQYTNLAYFHWLLGQYEDALVENEEAVKIARSAGSRVAEARCLKNLAQVYWSLGLPRRALAYADQALEAVRGAPEGARTEGHVLTARGRIWLALQDDARALEDLTAALAIRRRLGDGLGEALALIEVARIHADRGGRREARESVESALRLSRAAHDPRAQVRELVLLGQINQAEGKWREADASWKQALEMSRGIADRAGESSAEFAMARAARERGQLEDALRLAEGGLTLVESLRAEIPLPDLRAAYGASADQDRELLTEILIALDRKSPGKGFAEQAFAAAERTRARALTEAIAEGSLAAGPEIPEALRAGQAATSGRIAFLQRRLADARPQERPRLQSELAAAEEDFDRTVLEIRRKSPRLGALRYPRPLTPEQARALLAPDEALVSYALTGDGLFAFLLTRSGVGLWSLPADIRLLPSRVENFVELLSRSDPSTDPLGDRLAADLIEPLLARLPAGTRRLVIVPDGPLLSLPFEAIPIRSGGRRRPLIQDFAVSYAPSATVLASLSAPEAAPAAEREDLIAFADPALPAAASGSGGESERLSRGFTAAALARIPGARREVEAIAKSASSGSRIYEDAQASEARVKRERLDRYRILHFATHGVLSLENPGRSAIVLAALPGDGEDGLLQAREISGLKLASDLVVLSGCETARGRALAGEGVQSLARAFFLAGSRSVVASLWRVRDEAAEELMTAFYRRLSEGQAKDDALRAAKLDLLQRPRTSSPRDWAAFVLIGEPSAKLPLSPGRRPRGSGIASVSSSLPPPATR